MIQRVTEERYIDEGTFRINIGDVSFEVKEKLIDNLLTKLAEVYTQNHLLFKEKPTYCAVWYQEKSIKISFAPFIKNVVKNYGEFFMNLNLYVDELLGFNKSLIVFPGWSNGYFYALNASDGGLIWKKQINICRNPIVYNDIVYIANNEGIFGFSITNGDLKWRFLGNFSNTFINVRDDKMFCGTKDGILYAIDLSENRIIWEFKCEGEIGVMPTITKHIIFVSCENSNKSDYLYAINIYLGELIWKRIGWHTDSTAIYNSLYVIEYYKGAGRLLVLDLSTGVEKWVFEGVEMTSLVVGNEFIHLRRKDSFNSFGDNLIIVEALSNDFYMCSNDFITQSQYDFRSPVVYGLYNYAITQDSNILAKFCGVDKRWQIEGKYFSSTHPTILNDEIFVNDYNCTICLDAKTGEEKWRFTSNLYDEFRSSSVCVVSTENKVYRGLGAINPFLHLLEL